MTEMINEMNSQTAVLPQWVQMWMNWMMVIFLAAILFAKNHVTARFTLIVFLLTLPAAMLIFYLTRNIHLFALVHLLFWTPLLYYIFKKEFKLKNLNIKSPYGIWLVLLSLTIVISLLFDGRDVALVLMGEK